MVWSNLSSLMKSLIRKPQQHLPVYSNHLARAPHLLQQIHQSIAVPNLQQPLHSWQQSLVYSNHSNPLLTIHLHYNCNRSTHYLLILLVCFSLNIRTCSVSAVSEIIQLKTSLLQFVFLWCLHLIFHCNSWNMGSPSLAKPFGHGALAAKFD